MSIACALATPFVDARDSRSPSTPAAGNASAPVHPTDRMGANISGGLPAMGGITPSRAELPVSAFAKLDAQRRGYLTRDDVASLESFERAFRAADRDGDGRLNAAEFERAWAIYGGQAP